MENLVSAGQAYSALLEAEQRSRGQPRLLMVLRSEGGGFQAATVGPAPSVASRGAPGHSGDGGPSGQKMKKRRDQVKNSAGGYVFAVSDETRVRRFLIMGTSGGTCHVSEKELTIDNLDALIGIIEKGKAAMILDELHEISTRGRNHKQDAIMFALALCARYRVCDVNLEHPDLELSNAYVRYLKAMHRCALDMVNEVCRIPTHLFAFVKYCELVSKETAANLEKASSGWGRAMRKTVCRWYTTKSAKQLAMAVTKYVQRDGWTHRDLFRLCHPKLPCNSDDEQRLEMEQIFRYVVKGNLQTRKRRLSPAELAEEQPETKYSDAQMDKEDASEALDLIEAFKSLKDTDEWEVVRAIWGHGLVREHIPSEHLNSVAVWEALLEKMPMTGMLRNLSKMQSLRMIEGDKIAKLIAKITDEDAIRKSRVHPIQILLAHHIYSQGHGEKGNLRWWPEPKVERALEKAFYMSFRNVEPTGSRFCFAFDVSASMNQYALGSMISCRKAAVAVGMIALRTEENVEVVAFSDGITEVPYQRDWTLQKTCDHLDSLRFGATDCALPMLWAKKHKKQIDCFVVFTDSETYYGEVHPFVALHQYREASGIQNAKLVVMGMSSTGFSIADPNDAGMMDIAGFDAAVPELMQSFVRGVI